MTEEAGPRDSLGFVSFLLLAAATLASAWCAYQGSLWSGEQTRNLARASVAQFSSLRKTTIVNRDLAIDVGTFLNYADADLHGDTKIARFLHENARPELKPALDAWIADRASGRPEITVPFRRPEYHLAEWDEAKKLDAQAADALTAANAANSYSDTYLLHTVLFALSLFLLSAVTQARRRSRQRATLILGALAFTITVISMARLPRASLDPPRPIPADLLR